MTGDKRRTWLGLISIIGSLSVPFLTGGALDIYVRYYPRVLRYTPGKYILSFSLLVAVVMVFLATQRYVKSRPARFMIRLPVFVIFIALSYLLTIRSYCDPCWYGEEYDEGTTVAGCVDEGKATPHKDTADDGRDH